MRSSKISGLAMALSVFAACCAKAAPMVTSIGSAQFIGMSSYTMTTTATASAGAPIIIAIQTHGSTYATSIADGHNANTCWSAFNYVGYGPTARFYTCSNPAGLPSGSTITLTLNTASDGLFAAVQLTGTTSPALDTANGGAGGASGTMSGGSSGSGYAGMNPTTQPSVIISMMSVDNAVPSESWAEDLGHGWTTSAAISTIYSYGGASIDIAYKNVITTTATPYAPGLGGSSAAWIANQIAYDYTAGCVKTLALMGAGC